MDVKTIKPIPSAVEELKELKLPQVQYVSPYGDVLLDLHCVDDVENVSNYRLFDVHQILNEQFYALKQLQDPKTGLTFLTNRSRNEHKFRLNLLSSVVVVDLVK